MNQWLTSSRMLVGDRVIWVKRETTGMISGIRPLGQPRGFFSVLFEENIVRFS